MDLIVRLDKRFLHLAGLSCVYRKDLLDLRSYHWTTSLKYEGTIGTTSTHTFLFSYYFSFCCYAFYDRL